MQPNNSFKPKPLRSGKNMAEKACHVFTSTTRFGLTQALALMENAMELAGKTDQDILSIANPIMDNLMDASTAIDHERHIRDFTDRLKGVLSKERLEWICQDYQSTNGFFAEREFVAAFRRPESVAVVWKQRFTKQPGDFVAELVLVQQDGRYLVDHVMVF